MYSDDEIQEKLILAEKLKLSGRELLQDISRMKRVCNGVGAEWMGDSVRKVITDLNPALILPADIHDIRYDIGGTSEERKKADEEFLENGIKCANYRYRWYNPLRYLVHKQAYKYYNMLRIAGFIAWSKK